MMLISASSFSLVVLVALQVWAIFESVTAGELNGRIMASLR